MLRQVWADAAITISDSSSGTECSNCSSNTDDNHVWNIYSYSQCVECLLLGDACIHLQCGEKSKSARTQQEEETCEPFNPRYSLEL